ncbi:probable disease resistance protein [Tanacetum coccineum]|uniref:Probable disease resistance protein n=1 Tax=Tanacetum coccineum TaxID=301880 RepID=A0ABQ5GJV9_9ASTR
MESFIGGKLLDAASSKLSDIISDVITDVLTKTWYFKSLLTEIKETMKNIKEKRDLRKEESNKFIDLIKEAEELIRECEQMKSVNLWKRYRHAKKLDELNKSLSAFVEQFPKKTSSGWSSGVPLPDGDVIGFEDRVNDLKRMVVIVARLLQKNHQGQLNFNSDEDATHQWGSFLNENISEEILLVLDDVWSDSIVKNFKFKSPRYRILVTSRFIFTQFKTYELQPLKDQHATKLFRSSSLSENESEKNDARNDLVDKLVKCCKNHPLVLSVIGGSLKGKTFKRWQKLFRELSKRKHDVWDQHDLILNSLEKTLHQLDQPVIKECFMDLGSFPEESKDSCHQRPYG